jgi:uncharacterized protein (TIGR01244 family)
MRRVRLFVLAAACATAALGCAAPVKAERFAARTETLESCDGGGMGRLHTFEGVFLAGQPTPEDLAQANRGGVKTVVNLRHASENADFDEAKLVSDAGMTYVNIPWASPAELTDAVFDRARDALNTAERPILVHCAGGNRVGTVWIAWRTLDGGLRVDDAVAEARAIGLTNADCEAKARDYVARRAAPR